MRQQTCFYQYPLSSSTLKFDEELGNHEARLHCQLEKAMLKIMEIPVGHLLESPQGLRKPQNNLNASFGQQLAGVQDQITSKGYEKSCSEHLYM